MKKKALALLLAGIMILVSVPFACAEGAAEAELFDLWDYGGESMAWLTFAVPISEGILIAASSALPETTEHLAVSDGVNTWEAKAVIPDYTGRLALVFYDPSRIAARGGTWSLLPYGESIEAASCRVRCADAAGSRIDRAVLAVEETVRQGSRCLLLTLSDPAPAGSPVLTADGQLAGIVTAQWAEGENRVLAVPPEEIVDSLNGIVELLAYLPEWSEAPEGLEVSMKKNTVTFDWSEMTLPEPPEGEKWYLVFTDTGNPYLTYWAVEGEHSFTELLTPGRFYAVGLMTSAGAPDAMPEKLAFFFVPRAKRLTEYSFTPMCTAIAESVDGGDPVPVTEVTEELLRSGRAYFYSHSTYQVVGTFPDVSLLVTLTDPNGANYRWASSWVYSPDYMKEDIWSVPLKDTGLTANLDAGGYPAGVYTIAYYVNGDLADSFEFTLGTGN